MLKGLFGLLYWTAIIVFFVKGKIKWAMPLTLLTLSFNPLILGLIFMYSFPKNNIDGQIIPELPLALALSLFLLSIFSIRDPKKPPSHPSVNPSKIRWVYLAAGLFIYFVGLAITLMYFYVPSSFGHAEPMPHYGVTCSVLFSLISSVLLYLASREGSVNRPNVIRVASSLVIFLLFSQCTLIISLILIYSFPVTPATSYPMLAALNMVSYLVFGVTLILMRREYVKIA